MTVSAVAVKDLATELQRRQLLSKAQCSLAALTPVDAEQRLPEWQLRRLWQRVAEQPHADSLGLEIGQQVNWQARGVLSRWLSHCATLGDALHTFVGQIALLNAAEYWQLTDDGQLLTIHFAFHQPYPQIATERSMAAMLAWGRALLGRHDNQPLPVVAVRLARVPPADPLPFQHCFGSAITFAGPDSANCIVLSADVLQLPLPGADTYLHDLLAERARTIHQRSGQPTLSARVCALLQRDLAHFCQMENICRALHLSRTTLFRRLRIENTSFSQLLLQQRQQILALANAERWSHEQLTERLGFADAGSCYRFLRSH